MLNWFKSYLCNRKQYVFLNGESSKDKDITCGVPQGSVLGPLLFLLYINDLPNISKSLNFYLFADDTNIYYEVDSLVKLESKINMELSKLLLWLNVNRPSLNISKTNYVIFHPFISCKISKAIGVMYKLRPYINPTMLKNIYYSLIYSHMIYAIQV